MCIRDSRHLLSGALEVLEQVAQQLAVGNDVRRLHKVTDLIVTQKIKKKLTWAKLAEIVGHSKEWSLSLIHI